MHYTLIDNFGSVEILSGMETEILTAAWMVSYGRSASLRAVDTASLAISG